MGNIRKKGDIKKSLLAKGFEYKEGGKHELYILKHENKMQALGTKLSHGSNKSEYDDNLLGKMSKQLLLSKSELLNLIDCPMDQDEYLKVLKERGVL